MGKRYYYRTIDGSGWISVKAPRFAHDKTKIEISEEEFINHIKEIKKTIPIKVLSSPVQADQDGRNIFQDVDVRNELYDWLDNKGFSKEICFIIFYDVDQEEYGLGFVSPSTNGDVYFIVGNSNLDLVWEIVSGNKVVYFE